MKIVLWTQYRENYGLESGGDYWKNKGGSTYILEGVSVEEACDRNAFDALIAKLYELIEYGNPASIHYIIDWSLEDDSEPNHRFVEEWESPCVITRKGDKFVATRFRDNTFFSGMSQEVHCIRHSYTMLPNGERENFERHVIYRDMVA